MIARLTPEQLDHQWDHPIFGPITIERTVGIVARHLRSHIKDLQAALQRVAGADRREPVRVLDSDRRVAYVSLDPSRKATQGV